jgi:heptosyltransferase-3
MKPAQYKKILIIATRQIGDTLITTPLIDRAHEIWPQAQIDFLGFENSIGILKGHPALHTIIGTSKKPRLQEYFQLFKKIGNQYDLAIITQPSDRAYLYGFFSASHRVGVCHPGQEDQGWKKWITQHQVPIDYFSQHVVTEKLKLLDPFIDAEQISKPIKVTPPRFESLPAELQDGAIQYVVIHPSPLNDYKCWPINYWIELIRYFAEHHTAVVISGGPDRKDQLLAESILQGLKPTDQQMVLNMTGRLSFGELAHVLHQAVAYVGVDTAITHLSAACQTPTIALFGATPPTNFGPWPNGTSLPQPYALRAPSQTVANVTILQGPGDCVPCRKAGCDDTANSRSLCLEELIPSRVIDAFENLSRKTIPIQHI